VTTPDEDFAACEISDRLLERVLGPDLGQATLRLAVLGLVVCAILAAISAALG
jgi:hypothetical protein